MKLNNTEDRVTDYIDKLPEWQRTVCNQVRRLVHQADPEVRETIKRSTQPYFVIQGNVCALMGTKDHVNIFIYDPIAADPAGLINQGHQNASARTIQVYEADSLDDAALLALFKAVIANNRAGGWRKLQKS